MENALLEARQCSIHFGGLKAVDGVGFSLSAGELIAVIGPNGAGKTTLFNLITGIYRPTKGDILFCGKSIKGAEMHILNHLGIARTFQNIRLFSHLSVEDNIRAAFYQHLTTGLFQAAMRGKAAVREEEKIREKVFSLLELFHLAGRKNDDAASLSYGEQRRLEIVRALATRPKLLLLDEPAAGMNPVEKKELIQLIQRIHQEYRLAIILIDHDMNVVMNIAPRIMVLDYGVVIAEGNPQEIRRNPKVIEAYLGEAQ